MSFFITPAGDAYSISRIGGAKAVEGGFILFGNGPDEIMEYQEAPTDVAVAWRNAMVALLSSRRRNRPVNQVDWMAVAATVDEAWARNQGWTPPPAVTAAVTATVAPAPATSTRTNRPTPTAAE